MENRKELVERRKHKRFRAKEGAFVVLMPHSTKLGRVIDISMGGLAFSYIESEERTNRSFELDIFSADIDFCLDKVPFETISDFEIREVPFSSITMRRCGVQFRELTHNQISKLEYFIWNHTIGEA